MNHLIWFKLLFELREPEEPTKDVLVSHQDRLVDLGLPEPAGLLAGEEHFDGHLLSSPAAEPHLPVASLPDLTNHLDLLGDGPLDLKEADVTLFKHNLNVSEITEQDLYRMQAEMILHVGSCLILYFKTRTI